MAAAKPTMDKKQLYGMGFVSALAVTALIAVAAPRFLAYWPGLVGLSALAAYWPVFGAKPRFPRELALWIGAVIGLAGLSCFWALDSSESFSRVLKMTPILLSGVVLASAAISVPVRIIQPYAQYLIWAAIGGAVLCVGELAADYPLYRLVHGMDGDQAVAGSNLNRSVIAVLCFFFVAAGLAGQTMSRKIILGLFVVFSFMLFLTQSQSAQLGFVLALICFLAFPYSHKKVWYGFAAVLAAGVLGAPFLAGWLYETFAETVAQMPWLGRGGGFGGERLEIWDKVGRYALQNPLYGFGIEATRVVQDFDTAQIYRKGITELHPHNFAIQIWIEFGLVGAAFFAAFLARLMVCFSRLRYEQARIALPSFMILLSAASFGYGLWQSWFLGLFMFTVAIVILAMRLYEAKT